MMSVNQESFISPRATVQASAKEDVSRYVEYGTLEVRVTAYLGAQKSRRDMLRFR